MHVERLQRELRRVRGAMDLRDAQPVRYYKGLGVKIKQVMTDNGAAYKSHRFAKLLRRLGIKYIRTRPLHAPNQWQGGALHPDAAARMGLRLNLPGSDHRAHELKPWMYYYNFHRPHWDTSHRPPITRLGFDGNNVLRNYS